MTRLNGLNVHLVKNNGGVSSNYADDNFETRWHSFVIGQALSMASCGGKNNNTCTFDYKDIFMAIDAH